MPRRSSPRLNTVEDGQDGGSTGARHARKGNPDRRSGAGSRVAATRSERSRVGAAGRPAWVVQERRGDDPTATRNGEPDEAPHRPRNVGHPSRKSLEARSVLARLHAAEQLCSRNQGWHRSRRENTGSGHLSTIVARSSIPSRGPKAPPTPRLALDDGRITHFGADAPSDRFSTKTWRKHLIAQDAGDVILLIDRVDRYRAALMS